MSNATQWSMTSHKKEDVLPHAAPLRKHRRAVLLSEASQSGRRNAAGLHFKQSSNVNFIETKCGVVVRTWREEGRKAVNG